MVKLSNKSKTNGIAPFVVIWLSHSDELDKPTAVHQVFEEFEQAIEFFKQREGIFHNMALIDKVMSILTQKMDNEKHFKLITDEARRVLKPIWVVCH